jgi:ABC-type dipeptide/oligopeptide/nickel transport system, ATPase component
LAETEIILEVRNLHTLLGGTKGILQTHRPPVRAVAGVNLAIRRGEVLGVVGESGCGKSTLGRTILGIQRETTGTILLDGQVVSGLPPRQARRIRHDIQYVYQDPGASLDPWWSIGRTLREALKICQVGTKAGWDELIDKVLTAVGLELTVKRRYPHELSGGQLRRVGLARTLILSPRLVILDEPTAGLDLSVQAAVLCLIRDLQQQLGLTYIFISHDLSVVRQMCDRIAIMYLGRIVELAKAEDIFRHPTHPYTRALLAAAPRLDPTQTADESLIRGEPPNPAELPSGCAFHTRCPYAIDACAQHVPESEPVTAGHTAACLRWREIAL